MILNRQLGVDDYLGMLRRQKMKIIVPLLIMPVIGYLASYAVPPKYTSTSSVLVQGQQIDVKAIATVDLQQRILQMEQEILSSSRLRPMIEKLGLAKGDDADAMVADIRANISIQPMDEDTTNSAASSSAGAKTSSSPKPKRPGSTQPDFAGFNVLYTASNPRVAQQVCNELTSMLLEENLKQQGDKFHRVTDFYERQVQEAKQNLDQMDAKFAAFKRQYMGQLPEDQDANLKLLMGLNQQLDANVQALNRAQQDKTFSEANLSSQLAAWKASISSGGSSPQALDQQIAAKQTELSQLQSRYTPDHPDVRRAERDLADLRRKAVEANNAAATAPPDTQKANAGEPAEIRQIRLQIHQYEQIIAQATRDQGRLQQQIQSYQAKVAVSPAVEEQYKVLTRDYDTANKAYQDLLAKKDTSTQAQDVQTSQLGEQFQLLNSADLPDAPSFPKRWLFLAGGVGAGLGLGFALALLFELKDTSIRTEPDVEAVLELPTLISLPWLGAEEEKNPEAGGSTFWRKSNKHEPEKETIEV